MVNYLPELEELHIEHSQKAKKCTRCSSVHSIWDKYGTDLKSKTGKKDDQIPPTDCSTTQITVHCTCVCSSCFNELPLSNHKSNTKPNATLTYNVSTNSTDEVNEPNPEPTNGAFNLNPNIELDWDDDNDVNNSQVDEGGGEPTPELLSSWPVWISILVIDSGTVEATDVTKTIDLPRRKLQSIVQI